MTSRNAYRIFVGLTISLFLFSVTSAQEVIEKKTFEGLVEFEVRDFQSIQQYTLMMKGGRLRVQAEDQEGANAILIDYGIKKTFIVASGAEQYVELTPVLASAKAPAGKPRFDFHKTDSTAEIQGYECDQFLISSDSIVLEVWATKAFGTAGTFLVPQVTEWEWKILEMGYFPMRFVASDASGEEISRFEAKDVQKKSFNESLFRVPSGYEKVSLESLQPKRVEKKKRGR
jgi:hypothetical protein